MHIFGATIYVHNPQAKKLDPKTVKGIFLGYGASTAVIYYLDQNKSTVKRAHHARVDDLEVGGHAHSPGSMLIRQHADLQGVLLPESSSILNFTTSPFSYDNLFSFEVSLPPSGPLGLNLEDDKVFGLPVINYMHDDSPFKTGCKKTLQKNAWIVGVHHNEPITVSGFMEYIAYLRENKINKIQITLTKRVSPAATNFQLYCNYFDNFRPIAAHATLIIPEAN